MHLWCPRTINKFLTPYFFFAKTTYSPRAPTYSYGVKCAMKRKYSPKCGNSLAGDFLFCMSCGYKREN